MTSPEIVAATFRLVARCHNQLRHRVPRVCMYYFKLPTQHRVYIKMNLRVFTTNKTLLDTRLHSLATGHMKTVSCTSAWLAIRSPHAYEMHTVILSGKYRLSLPVGSLMALTQPTHGAVLAESDKRC